MTGRRFELVRLVLVAVLLLSTTTAHAQGGGPIPVVVKILPGTPLIRVLDSLSGQLVDSISGTNIYLLNVPRLPLLQPVLGLLGNTLKLLGLEWLEVNNGVTQPSHARFGILQVSSTTGADWYKRQPANQLMRAAQANVYATGRGVVVADINSRVEHWHPGLAGHLTTSYDFVSTRPAGSAALNQSSASFLDQSSASFLDQSSASFLDQSSASFLDQSSASFLDDPVTRNPAYSHGTLTVGVIAALAPEAMIMPIRAFDDNGSADLFILAKAIRHAVNQGAHVINMSFGTLEQSKAVKDSIEYARSRGVVLVASAGNNNTSAVQYPAAYSGVVAIAATDLKDVKASFSNYGGYVFADAPGLNIISTFPNNYYAMVSGTSFSAPAVAATAALVRSLKTSGVTTAIAASAVDIDGKNPNYRDNLGYGRIDMLRAVKPY